MFSRTLRRCYADGSCLRLAPQERQRQCDEMNMCYVSLFSRVLCVLFLRRFSLCDSKRSVDSALTASAGTWGLR